MGIPIIDKKVIDELRDEKKDNYDKGINTDENEVIFVDGVYLKSDNLRKQLFTGEQKKKYLREVELDEMTDEERNRMNLMAKMVEVVYDRRRKYGMDFFNENENRRAYKEVEKQNIGNYTFEDTGNDLSARFVNNDNNEVVLAFRGLLPNIDRKDLKQFGSMVRSTIFENERAEGFGSQYKLDKQLFNEEYRKAKQLYPKHKLITTGHSRGSRGAIHLGRKHNLEFHAFSPVGNRGDFIDSVPVEQGHLYYNNRDPTSIFIKSQRGKTIEQHHSGFNKKLNPHSLTDFYDGTKILKHKKLNKKELDEFEKKILLDIKSGEPDSGEDYVDSDLGRFDDITLFSKDLVIVPSKEVATIPRKDIMILPMRNIYTGEIMNLNMGQEEDVKFENAFNKYTPSVFNDLNLKAPKPFEPDYFEEIDRDKNNEISYKELFNYLNSKGYSKQDIDELFSTFDINNDGKISRREFYKLKQSL